MKPHLKDAEQLQRPCASSSVASSLTILMGEIRPEIDLTESDYRKIKHQDICEFIPPPSVAAALGWLYISIYPHYSVHLSLHADFFALLPPSTSDHVVKLPFSILLLRKALQLTMRFSRQLFCLADGARFSHIRVPTSYSPLRYWTPRAHHCPAYKPTRTAFAFLHISAMTTADKRNSRPIRTAACLIIGDEVLGGKV